MYTIGTPDIRLHKINGYKSNSGFAYTWTADGVAECKMGGI